MHRRFDELYGLSNLLWIYTADIDPQMFPGDDYVDIVGCDVYDNTDTAHLAAMYATDSLTLNKRMLALTECAVYPDPDIMARITQCGCGRLCGTVNILSTKAEN